MTSMKKNNLVYLADVLAAIDKIEDYLDGISHEDFLVDSKTQDAVIRNLLTIGEAMSRLSPALKNQVPNLSIREAIDMRNLLIHDYDMVNLEIVWDTIQNDLPSVKDQIAKLIHQAEEK